MPLITSSTLSGVLTPAYLVGSSVAPGVRLNFGDRIVFAGDSITANGSAVSGNDLTMSNTGYWNWAQNLSGHRLYMPNGGNKGFSGDTTGLLLARYGAVLALSPKVVGLLIGTNDLPATSGTTITTGNIAQMLAMNRAAGAYTILLRLLPRGSTASPMSADYISRWETINAWISDQASSMVTVIDAEPVIGNGDAAHTMLDGYAKSTDGTAYLHPNGLGAYKIGKLVAAAISNLVPSGDFIAPLLGTSYASNGLLTGTTGSKDASITGQVATSWQGFGGSAGGATVAASKLSRTTAEGEWQQVAVTGTYTGSSRTAFLRLTISNPAGLNAGDLMETFGEAQIDSPTSGIAAVGMRLSVNGGAAGVLYLETPASITALPWPEAYSVKFRSLPYTLSALPTSLNLECHIVLGNTATTDPATATVRFGRVGVRRA
jgi:lysophospholipase L1-like esterase